MTKNYLLGHIYCHKPVSTPGGVDQGYPGFFASQL